MATKRVLLLMAAVPLLLLNTQGCGLLYPNVTRSESRDFQNTPVASKSFSLSAYRVQVPLFIPFSRLTRASASWDTDRINELAAKAGMTTIHYTDFKTQEILLGTLRRQTIIVYGE
jgi:hypothetical protein